MVEISWAVQMPAGDTIVLNGTIQDVYSQVTDLDLAYGTELEEAAKAATRTNGATDSNESSDSSLEKRDSTICDVASLGGLANEGRVEEGIAYLRTIPGYPTNGPGPGNCGQVSCSYNAAILWCNDVSCSMHQGM